VGFQPFQKVSFGDHRRVPNKNRTIFFKEIIPHDEIFIKLKRNLS